MGSVGAGCWEEARRAGEEGDSAQRSLLPFSFFILRATAEIKGDIFTATEIENHWTHGGR